MRKETGTGLPAYALLLTPYEEVTVREALHRGWERLSGPWVRRRQRKRARSLIIAGNAALTRDDDLRACSSYEESLALARSAGDRPAAAAALLGLGWVALQQRNPAAARTFLEKSLAVARDVGDEVRLGAVTGSLAYAAFEQYDFPTARSLYEESLRCYRNQGCRREAAGILASISEL